MSSATPSEPSAVRRMLQGLASKLASTRKETTQDSLDRIARLGMSRRQQELNHFWAWYRSERYSTRKIDWNGHEALDSIETEAIATQGTIPPGFYDAGGQMMPIKFRRPTTTYALPRVITNRFTGLLFSERNHPHIKAEGDPATDEFIGAMIEASRLWQKMILARTYGGGMGSVAVSFKFVNGRPDIEVHDPRWTQPTFRDRENLELSSLEKRYMYVTEERDERGVFVSVWKWYRRIIDETSDTLYLPTLVGEGDEPDWQVQTQIEHGLGFCPAVWIQNTPVQDDFDGDPDCHGIYDLVETIDQHLSQSSKGLLANLDPTLVIKTDATMSDVRKGSDNAIKLPSAGDAKYLEMAGSGPTASTELAFKLRELGLEVAQVVLEHGEQGTKTAFEIERLYSSMFERADVFREQYGQKGVLQLVQKMVDAVRKLDKPRADADGQMTRSKITLPPKMVRQNDGTFKAEEHKLGSGGYLTIRWPKYVPPTIADTQTAITAAAAAKVAGLIDREHAVQFVAEYLRIEDVRGMVERIEKERAKERADGTDDMLMRMRGPGFGGP